MEYLLHLAIFIALYTILAQSLNLVSGYVGLISLAHAGFYGIGAYTTALLSLHFHSPFWLNVPLAMLLSGACAIVVALIALRTVEDYFIICTLGIQVIAFSIMNNWMSVTEGPLGLPGIPSITLFGTELRSRIALLLLSLCFTVLVWLILRNLVRSGFGKTLIAISEDEIYSQSIGKNVYQAKIVSFTISAMLAAIPGALYAHYVTYVDPTSFTLSESIFILSIVIIGGMGNLTGSFLAAIFMVLLPEVLRFVGISDHIAANMRQIIYGFILVIVMMSGKNGLAEITEQVSKEQHRDKVV